MQGSRFLKKGSFKLLRKFLPNLKLTPGMVLHFLFLAAGIWILAANRILFFQGNRVIKSNSVMNPSVDIPLETCRRPIFSILIILIVLAALDTLFAFCGRKAHEKRNLFRNIPTALLAFCFVFLNAVLSFFEIELINNYYLVSMDNKFKLINILITFALYLVFVFALNSVSYGLIAGNLFFFVWGTANYFVQKFRGTPLQWVDFSSMRTAASVADNYKYTPNWEVAACAVLTFVLVVFIGNRRIMPMFGKTVMRVATRGIAAVILAVFAVVFFKTDFLADEGVWLRDWQPWYTYRLFGVESGFLEFAKASFPKAPEGYSQGKVREIIKETKEYTPVQTDFKTDVIPENIIIVMNEAFSDLRIYPGFECSESPMPFIDSLKENTMKGELLVSVKGGTTCNTEYEFLTGNSCVLSPTTVVFTSFIKDNQYSIARTLADQGYRTVAMHPYKAKGWSRTTVYPRMGFDEFLSIENAFADAETVRGYVSDRGDYREIIRQTEEKKKGEKLFLFNVTMQNHSSYEDSSFENTLHVLNYDGPSQNAADQYNSLVHLSDEAAKELIEYYSRSDQKTLICFFGDHQPEISDSFWEYCSGKTADSLTFEEQQRQFQSRYFIWANYDIPESDGEMLSANYLSSVLLSLTGLEKTPYNEFLLHQREQIPAMNAFGYLGTDGKQHEWDTGDVSAEDGEQLLKYKSLIYNELTGGGGRDKDFFGLAESSGK